ncbi:hypothetical protein PanWU01x14_112270 [Parasponia andersonii]|uniref:Uncharacterized protein n=1 Tax=Parasponia andersonii TaxID=3476 RepID=A0A2P5CY75_PARAD|nr:hypothetical protein PanWU01x14_112270 [Parasponia andersonii]
MSKPPKEQASRHHRLAIVQPQEPPVQLQLTTSYKLLTSQQPLSRQTSTRGEGSCGCFQSSVTIRATV